MAKVNKELERQAKDVFEKLQGFDVTARDSLLNVLNKRRDFSASCQDRVSRGENVYLPARLGSPKSLHTAISKYLLPVQVAGVRGTMNVMDAPGSHGDGIDYFPQAYPNVVCINPNKTYHFRGRDLVQTGVGKDIQYDYKSWDKDMTGREIVDQFCDSVSKDCDKQIDALQKDADAAMVLMNDNPQLNKLVRSYMLDADRTRKISEIKKSISTAFERFQDKVADGFDRISDGVEHISDKVRLDFIPTAKVKLHEQEADALVADMESKLQMNSFNKGQMSL